LIVNYGLSNNGAKCAAIRLEKFRKKLQANAPQETTDNIKPFTNYGISIAPTTSIAFDDMAEDYTKSFDLLLPYADYITLNVSCPNVVSNTVTSQLNFIEKLLHTIHHKQKNFQNKKDIFIKIGAHHNTSELDKIVELSKTYELAGIVATNLLKQREGTSFYSLTKQLAHPGGISGLPVQNLSDQTIRYLYQKSNGKLSIIGVGGIFTAEDAYRKIKLGASAVQIITGFIYGGPLIVKNINQGLAKLLEKDGLNSILQAIGKDS
jgi:dihydroorotate dehydrogenase